MNAKKIFLSILACAVQLICLAQYDMVAAWKKLPENKKDLITIKKNKQGKLIAYDVSLDLECKLKINNTTGFLEIENTGTGGGTGLYQLKMLKNKANNPVLVYNKDSYEPYMHQGETLFFDYKTMKETDGNWQDVTLNYFFKSGTPEEAIEKNKDLFTQEYDYTRLSEKTNEMFMHHGYGGLDDACRDKNKMACDIKKTLNDKLTFLWNKNTVGFEMQ